MQYMCIYTPIGCIRFVDTNIIVELFRNLPQHTVCVHLIVIPYSSSQTVIRLSLLLGTPFLAHFGLFWPVPEQVGG